MAVVEQTFGRLAAALSWAIRTSALGAAGIVVLLMALVVADITGRYLFNSPVPMTYEVGSFMLVFIVFLGLAYSQLQGAHIRVEFFTLRLPPKPRALLDLLAYTLGIAIYSAIFYQGFKWAYDSFVIGEYVAGLVNIPKWPSQFAVVFGALLLALQFVADWIRRARQTWLLFAGQPQSAPAAPAPEPSGDG